MYPILSITSELKPKPMLKPGDIFLTTNQTILQKMVNFIQRFWSKDDKSKYGHAGIIINGFGDTFESQWKVMKKNIWKDYSNCKLLIARHSAMNYKTFMKSYLQVYNEHYGEYYPVYRILFYLYPPLTKLSIGKVVCSELAAKFLWNVEMMPFFNGCNPDTLHDHICWGAREGQWEIIYIQR